MDPFCYIFCIFYIDNLTQSKRPNVLQNLAQFDTPKIFSHFLLLFFRFFCFLAIPPYQGGKNRGKKGPKSTKIFWGVFWIHFVIFFAFLTFGTYLKQNGARFCKLWSIFSLKKVLVTFYCCFFRSNPRFLNSPKRKFWRPIFFSLYFYF